MSAGAAAHSCYMLYNGISHDETPGLTGYTAEGDVAGNSGNVAVSSQINTSARSHIELWMSGPFHAIGVLRPNLRSTGFGKCDMDSTPTWHSGATLDVLRGLGGGAAPSRPDPVPRQRHHDQPRPLRRRVAEPHDLLRLDRLCRPADHRHDAGSRQQRQQPRSIGPNGQADRGLRALAPRTPAALPSRSCRATTQSSSCPARCWPRAPTPLPPTPRLAMSTGASRSIRPQQPESSRPVPVAQPTARATGFAPLAPARIVDTRSSTGAARLVAGSHHPHPGHRPGRGPLHRQGGHGQRHVDRPGRLRLPHHVELLGTPPGGLHAELLAPTRQSPTPRPSRSTAPASCAPSAAGLPICSSTSVATTPHRPTGRYMPVSPVRLMDSREGVGTPARLARRPGRRAAGRRRRRRARPTPPQSPST